MSTRIEQGQFRSAQRMRRQAYQEILDRQSQSLDREYFVTVSLFRSFFLLGSLVLILANRDALLAASPLFVLVAVTWIYKNYTYHANTLMALRRIDYTLFSLRRSIKEFATEAEEADREFLDEMLRMKSVSLPTSTTMMLEPLVLMLASQSLTIVRVFGLSII